MRLLDVVLVGLATFRIARLVTRDTILDRPRRWWQRHLPAMLVELLGCPWCVSMYVGPGLAWLDAVHGSRLPVEVVLLGLAASAITGLLATLDPPEDYGVPDDEGPTG